MHSKVSSDWLPSYIKATQSVLEIFKMAGYFSGQASQFLTAKWQKKNFWYSLALVFNIYLS
jgi:hypothetical protein